MKNEPEEYYLPTDELKRLKSIRDLMNRALELPDTTDYQITIDLFDEKRRTVQNRLYFAWLREAGDHHGHTVGYMHGETKLEILQPMKLAWPKTHQQAMDDQQYLDMVIDYEARVKLSERIVRTSQGSLSVAQFADFLTAFQRDEAQKGLILVCKNDKEKSALSKGDIMTKDEKTWMQAMNGMGCSACLFTNGIETPNPAIHHIVEGSKRLGHLWTIPLCDTHHQYGTPEHPSYHSEKGKHGGAAAFEAEHGTQYELLAMCQEYVNLYFVDAEAGPPTKIVPRTI